MTTKTVEMEYVATKVEDVHYCDYCGNDEDAGKGELVPYDPDLPIDADVMDVGEEPPLLHFHEECLYELGNTEMGSLPTFDDITNDLTHPYYLVQRFDIGIGLVCSVIGYAAATTGYQGFQQGALLFPALMAIVTCVCAFVLICLHCHMRSVATKPIDKLANSRWWRSDAEDG